MKIPAIGNAVMQIVGFFPQYRLDLSCPFRDILFQIRRGISLHTIKDGYSITVLASPQGLTRRRHAGCAARTTLKLLLPQTHAIVPCNSTWPQSGSSVLKTKCVTLSRLLKNSSGTAIKRIGASRPDTHYRRQPYPSQIARYCRLSKEIDSLEPSNSTSKNLAFAAGTSMSTA